MTSLDESILRERAWARRVTEDLCAPWIIHGEGSTTATSLFYENVQQVLSQLTGPDTNQNQLRFMALMALLSQLITSEASAIGGFFGQGAATIISNGLAARARLDAMTPLEQAKYWEDTYREIGEAMARAKQQSQ